MDIKYADYFIAFVDDYSRPPSLCSYSDDCTAFLQEHVAEEDRAVSIPSTVIVELNLERSWLLSRLEAAGFEWWRPEEEDAEESCSW